VCIYIYIYIYIYEYVYQCKLKRKRLISPNMKVKIEFIMHDNVITAL
jgi:hypothetical protein